MLRSFSEAPNYWCGDAIALKCGPHGAVSLDHRARLKDPARTKPVERRLSRFVYHVARRIVNAS